jgi:hypothetical protein
MEDADSGISIYIEHTGGTKSKQGAINSKRVKLTHSTRQSQRAPNQIGATSKLNVDNNASLNVQKMVLMGTMVFAWNR